MLKYYIGNGALLCSEESGHTSVHVRRDGVGGMVQHKSGNNMKKDADTIIVLSSGCISVVFHR